MTDGTTPAAPTTAPGFAWLLLDLVAAAIFLGAMTVVLSDHPEFRFSLPVLIASGAAVVAGAIFRRGLWAGAERDGATKMDRATLRRRSSSAAAVLLASAIAGLGWVEAHIGLHHGVGLFLRAVKRAFF